MARRATYMVKDGFLVTFLEGSWREAVCIHMSHIQTHTQCLCTEWWGPDFRKFRKLQNWIKVEVTFGGHIRSTIWWPSWIIIGHPKQTFSKRWKIGNLMFKVYFEVFIHHGWRIVSELWRFISGYPWLPLATSHLVGDNRQYDIWSVFWGVLSIMSGRYSQNFEGSSLVILGYHWWPLVTSHLVNDNRELDIWGVFWDHVSTMGGG